MRPKRKLTPQTAEAQTLFCSEEINSVRDQYCTGMPLPCTTCTLGQSPAAVGRTPSALNQVLNDDDQHRASQETFRKLRSALTDNEHLVCVAQIAHLESIRRRFRAIWFTDATPFLGTEHFQELGSEFWLRERWMVRLGLLEAEDNELLGLTLHHVGQLASELHFCPTGMQLLTNDQGVNVISLFIPQVVGDVQLAREDWVTLPQAEERFDRCCTRLERFVRIACEGGPLWEDLVSSEAVHSQILGKDQKVVYRVKEEDVFLRKIECQRDVSALQLNCGWSGTAPVDDLSFAVELSPTGCVIEDLVIGSFKPFSLMIWNGRNIHRENFSVAAEDISRRNMPDVLVIVNTRLITERLVKGMLQTLPFDSNFSTPEHDSRAGVTVLWKSSSVNLLCGEWRYGGEYNTWISILSLLEEDGPW